MNPLGNRSRVEELARLLEGAVAGPGTATAGQAALATRLRALAPALADQAAPRPEFRAALRQRLIAVATVQASGAYAEPAPRSTALESAVSWTQSRKAQRRIGVTAGAMASVVALAGVGIASSRSLPGQPFYGLKRASEGAQLDFASGDTAKGAKHLEFAKTRLREVQALTHGDSMLSLGTTSGAVAGGSVSGHIIDTLADFNSETRDGQSLLEKAYRASGKTEPLTILKSFASSEQVRLTSLLPDLPGPAKAKAQESLELVFTVGSSANELLALGTCGGDCNPANGGPVLPTEPDPTPGVTATPSPDDSNGVPDCVCAPSPEPTVAPEPTVTPEPTDAPTSEPSPTSSPSPSGSPSPAPSPSPSSPLPVPTDLLPTGLPTIPPLPVPTQLPTAVPTLPFLPLAPRP